ncbi:UNVERIFIED_CONTAM: hypothetical protein PYX00_003310 [Menopon gallinae]|uniref:Secreted protein n=1 Tax=Menopon gallinae TaxID=328185 RepID=A0AAW2I160_9NEOP
MQLSWIIRILTATCDIVGSQVPDAIFPKTKQLSPKGEMSDGVRTPSRVKCGESSTKSALIFCENERRCGFLHGETHNFTRPERDGRNLIPEERNSAL